MSDDLRKIPKTGMIVEMPSFMESDEEIPQDQKTNEDEEEGESPIPKIKSPKSKVSNGFDTIELEGWLNTIYNKAYKVKGQKTKSNPLEGYNISLQNLITANVEPATINALYTSMYQAATIHD